MSWKAFLFPLMWRHPVTRRSVKRCSGRLSGSRFRSQSTSRVNCLQTPSAMASLMGGMGDAMKEQARAAALQGFWGRIKAVSTAVAHSSLEAFAGQEEDRRRAGRESAWLHQAVLPMLWRASGNYGEVHLHGARRPAGAGEDCFGQAAWSLL